MEYSIIVVLAIVATNSLAKKCESPRTKSLHNGVVSNDIAADEYVCPREFDPPSHVECCTNGTCCPYLEFDQSAEVVRIVAIIVISSCLLVGIILLVSCFWGRGVCYQCCRPKFTQPDVAMCSFNGEDDPLNLMPMERKGETQYMIGAVKVRVIDDV